MLGRSHWQQKIKTPADHTPVGKVFQVEGSDLHIYVPSCCLGEIDGLQLIPKTQSPQGTYSHKRIADAFFAYHSTSIIPTEKIRDHLNIAAEQSKDDLLLVIIQALKTRARAKNSYGPRRSSDSHLQETPRQILFGARYLRPDGQRLYTLTKAGCAIQIPQQIYISGTWLHQPLRHHSHEGTPSSYWWEFKNRDIETYVNSCSTCARCKGNYSKRVRWPFGHCKRGKRPFDRVFIDFVTMPNSKGKRYLLTILDGFSRLFTAIPCARDSAIDAAHSLYQFLLRHRKIPRIVSSGRGTHFTGEVYRQFCNQMSITQELHCPWWPQGSGNIERQYRTMKNALYMLCEDGNCEWTDVLESVISSMNATINSATGVSPHYTITGWHPNIGLPKLQGRHITNDNLGAYAMQINALLRQLHHCVAQANDEADHKLEASLNHLTYKDPIQVGDKVLLHRPKLTVVQSLHLPWVGDFEVTKTNHTMCQVMNKNGDTAWIH